MMGNPYYKSHWRETGSDVGGMVLGALSIVRGLIGNDSIAECIAFLALGLILIVGNGGLLALHCDKVERKKRFAVQVMVRVVFMALGPLVILCVVLTRNVHVWETVNITWCLLLSALTMLPFVISLIHLIWKKKRGWTI